MEKREVWKVIVLGLITFGIYDLYWLYKTRLELVGRGADVPPVKILLLPFAAILGIFLLQGITMAAMSSPTAVTTEPGSTSATSFLVLISVIVGLIALLVAIPLSIWWWHRYSKAVAQVTGGQMTYDMAFWLGILLGLLGVSFVMPGLIQDAYNKVGPPTLAPAATPAAS